MSSSIPTHWDKEVDVIVLGTGGAALTAAVAASENGANVLVLEKTHQIGGTTAFSGGVPWIPLNHYMKEAGFEDNREDAINYIKRLALGRADDHMIETFVDKGHEVIRFLHDHTPVKFVMPKSYPEYYARMDEALKHGTRSLDPAPYDLNEIGEWGPLVRQNPLFPPLTLEEGGAVGGIDFQVVAERMQNNIVTMGRSLIASLFKACLDRGVETLIETAGKELIINEDGQVVGLIAETKVGEVLRIAARKGVVLASGGFEWNKQLVRAFLKAEFTHPVTPPGNEGDALMMAMKAGAALENMSEAWWYPAMVDPTFEYEDNVMAQLGSGRMGPNSIVVNKYGRRFVHEGTTYNDMPRSFFNYDPVKIEFPNEAPVWMIFDQQLKDSQLIVTMTPGDPAPEWVDQADSIRELAEKIGVDPDGLEDEVRKWNEYCEQGVDPDFHRGTIQFEALTNGGGSPANNLGKIEKCPFYALPIYLGALGTNGGPKINENGQVVNFRGEPIKGLYAAGNASGNPLGPIYPSAGGTIGPAMVFGFLAGQHAANS
ncbi:FAD-dependent oxidoreductase [Robertmurraya andreesenii]|uniref:Succinate dehydrogenase/fumarate reductase flavoprotein subunit n=1 Tax=Anoxybacillus andreesenii TaxID=1325932 RepID=A0ABT9V9E1_9BACL|nr:FAD-dependent oxidoreductase [Robertmurraya andreesenii]MDQ0157584.1 succinate dehydrogenase/fumarate reductase flavoprotein subunit [Robertmurraya andreesenii]